MEPDNNKFFKFLAEPASVHNVFRAEVEAVEQAQTENLPNPNYFNPFNTRGDKAVLCSRICIITILVIRTFSSVGEITKINWIHNLPEGIIATILAVLGFLFVA